MLEEEHGYSARTVNSFSAGFFNFMPHDDGSSENPG